MHGTERVNLILHGVFGSCSCVGPRKSGEGKKHPFTLHITKCASNMLDLPQK